MPRYTSSQLRWSEQTQSYVLSIGDQTSTQPLTSDWLEHIASFSFHSRGGMRFTVRKQRVQRGGSYWYAYRRLHGRIVKRYLSKAADLTVARLEETARFLESASGSRPKFLEPEPGPTLAQPVPPVSKEDAGRASPAVILPLLSSKLSPPRLHGFLLDRSRLFVLLDAGQEYPLTLLSAPAGFGKTTLLCQWMAARRTRADFPPLAWLSLESADNDPLRFWRYLVAACQQFQVDLQEAHDALQALTPQPPFMPSSLESALTTLLNALARSPAQGILVLEDYHAITAPAIHETLSFFLDHLSPTLRLVMITRSDPPFSLARLRARNMLCEIRTADLRFSQEETALLLHHSLPFPLQTATVQRLCAQLQGWGAGLHLARLALQRISTPAEGERVLTLFPHNNASLQEYFVSEVLALQPEPVQLFLLQTSLFARLTASLCDAVTGQHNGQEMLTRLERGNLFLEPLDAAALSLSRASPQQWYRYHALFAEAMRSEARRRFTEDQLRQFFVRASRWYEMHDFRQEAIDAALAVQDYARAANLIARSIEEHTLPGEISEPYTVQRWLEQLPEAILEQNPVLCLSYAITLLFQSVSWQPDVLTTPLLERLLHMAERSFRAENDLSNLGKLLAFRSLLVLRQGNTQAAISAAEQALDWLPQTQSLWRGLSLSIVGEKWMQMGHFQQARAVLLEAYTLCEAVGNHFFRCVALVKLAQVYFEQGEIQQALSSFRQALPQLREEEQAKMFTHWRCVALLGLATLFYECNELDDASQHAQEALSIGQSRHLIHHEVHAALILARVQQARGQIFVAQQSLTTFLDKIPVSSPHLLREVQTALARLALAGGDQVAVQRWMAGRVPHSDPLQEGEEEAPYSARNAATQLAFGSSGCEEEAPYSARNAATQLAFGSSGCEEELLVARWLRSQGKLQEAAHLLERLLESAQKMEHTRRLLEVQAEQVLRAAAGNRKAEEEHLLRKVLAQAFARNAQRLFLDAGEPMADALRSLLPRLREQPLRAYVRALLNAFPDQQQRGAQAALVEPLSPQEMRVLRLLVQRRSNAEIANALVVSVNTVRTQVQSIYRKLGVHTRAAATEVARELHLL